MESIDQAQQWLDLKETYSQMAEGELYRVAADIGDLTPIAMEALKAEFAERGLEILPGAPTPPPEPLPETADDGDADPERRLICVRKLKSEYEAQQAKAVLDGNFIASCLGADNIVDLEDFKGSFSDGVDLKVFTRDSRRADSALEMFAPQEDEESAEFDEEAEYAVLCPKCHSPLISLSALVPKVDDELEDNEAKAAAANEKFNWTCDACGYEWKDEGIAQKL